MKKTTSTEFIDWMAYFHLEEEEKLRTVTKEDFYLAQIATEVRRTISKTPHKLSIGDFFLELEDKKMKDERQLTKAEQVAKSKSVWFAATGYSGDK